MKNLSVTALVLAVTTLLGACSPAQPPVEAPRTVRTAQVRYDAASEARRYTATVQSRYEVEHAFRVGGKVARRLVDVGQTVRAGDVLAMLEADDYRLAEDAARQQWAAAVTQARQAESDRQRLQRLKSDGSVSVADDERATSGAQTAEAMAEAQGRQLELARNRLAYTVLRASRSGVVTAARLEAGQMVAEGMPVVAIADPAAAELVVDVPEDQVQAFRKARLHASLNSAPDTEFELALRELAPQAAAQTRTYRARLKPLVARALPLGATATLVAERETPDTLMAVLPASSITQSGGQPAVWVVKRSGTEPEGTVELARVEVHGYRNEEVLVSGLAAGTRVVTAGVQKMAPGLKVSLRGTAFSAAPAPSAQTGR